MKIRSITFISLNAIIMMLSFFFQHTKGLISRVNSDDSFFYVTDSMGSNADDNVVIFAGVFIFLVPLVIRLVRFRKAVAVYEYIVFIAGLFFQFLFYVYGLNEGDYLLTLFHTENTVFTALTLAYATASIWIVFCLSQHINRRVNDIKNKPAD